MNTIHLLAQTTLKRDGFYGGALDGDWGPLSSAAASAWEAHNQPAAVPAAVVAPGVLTVLTARTLHNIASMDPKARPAFTAFALEANQIARDEFGGIYEIISGTRTWAEQTRLHNISLAGGPHAAAPGWSFHNLMLAGDGALMVKGVYMDGGTPAQQGGAGRFHQRMVAVAAKHGLTSGATWRGTSNDPPHIQYNIGHDIPTDADRAKFKATGSLL